jgi:6-phosphogluconolactonase (cycloisomerase 2 family)
MLGAEILLLPPTIPSGDSLLILSNRFSAAAQGDALALFTVSPDGGVVQPAKVPHIWGIGRHIRALDSDPSGRYVVAAGRDEGGVVVLGRTEDGLVEMARADIPNVVVPLWIK